MDSTDKRILNLIFRGRKKKFYSFCKGFDKSLALQEVLVTPMFNKPLMGEERERESISILATANKGDEASISTLY